jgi:Subtilase family
MKATTSSWDKTTSQTAHFVTAPASNLPLRNPERIEGSRFRWPSIGICSFAAIFVVGSLIANPLPQNLGNGLREIVQQSQQSQQAPRTTAAAPAPSIISYDNLKITDAQNRVLVRIVLDGSVALADVQRQITSRDASIAATDSHYHAGVIEAFVSPANAVEIAKMPGVSSVNLSARPHYNIGKATTQGIGQHRIDKIPKGINGSGITIGVLSDSYNTAGGPINAGDDVRSGDLPGSANPFGHTEPVLVFQDDVNPLNRDEGRAMLQIVEDIAPNSRLGFATANKSETGFADNIRSLAGLPDGSLSRKGFKADVIIDDVGYYDEPMFQDGIVAQAVDEVAAAGVAYFSAAGNQPASASYDSAFRLVPNTAAATANTNLNFKAVPRALYKGGFHNFRSRGGQDIAQTIHIAGDGIISFQWNEPYDPTPPTLGKIIQSGSGTLTNSMPTKSFPFAGTAGERIGIFADAAPGSNNPLPDVTIELFDPQGHEVASQDQTTDPELLVTFLPVTGTYTIVIGGFENATGDFIYNVRAASGTEKVETDFNLLFFDVNGNYLGAFAENNLATSRPIEVGQLVGTFDVQMVIARANIPPRGVRTADRLRYVWFDGGTVGEYINYDAPGTFGHPCANGASGVAAYPFYPPFVPESFTSPGPVTIYFDKDGNRLAQPDLRQKPDVAAMDGANTTFFFPGGDASQDPDTLPNFFGTSAAAPHAGGIAALVLQAAGGPHSLSPNAMRWILKGSAFPHDLDPNFAEVRFINGDQVVTIAADGDGTSTSADDPNFFSVTYTGGNSLSQFTINLTHANPTEIVKGLVFDTSAVTGFPFTLGNSRGINPSRLTTSFSLPAPPPAAATQFQELTVSVASHTFTDGDILRFGVDRDEADAFGPSGAVGGNSADLFGAGVLIPQGTIANGGASAAVKLSDGTMLQGVFQNRIGHGYSFLDGFGFINAQAAVEAVHH